MHYQEQDLRYGMTVRQVVREIDSPIFDSCRPQEYEPLDPSHKVFYGQFLRMHFDNYSVDDRVVAAIDLHRGFNSWRRTNMKMVDPSKYTESGCRDLYQIYSKMSIEGLFQHIDEESRPWEEDVAGLRSISLPDFTEQELNDMWLVASYAYRLDLANQGISAFQFD